MKKEEPIELTVEQKLKYLYQLQQINSKIDELRTLAGELPQEVKDMSDEVEGLRTRLSNTEDSIKDLETKISDCRVKIENNNASISRLKEQQDNVRNNREYDSINKEIEYNQLDIEVCQKRINDYTEALERRQNDKVETTKQIEVRQVDLTNKRADLDSILLETKEQVENLMLKATDLEHKIDSDERLLAAFKRIRKSMRNGLAVVSIDRDSCGGCHSKIPAQRQLDIRMHKKIIVCEFCGRILVDPAIENLK